MTIVAIMKTTFPLDMPCKEYNFLFWSLIRKKENGKVSGTSLVDSAGFTSSLIGHWLRAHHILATKNLFSRPRSTRHVHSFTYKAPVI